MTMDLNKGISSVEYNYLNMPTKVTVTGSNAGVLDYVYAADRTKLQKKKTQGGVTTTTDYIGNYVYEGNALKQITQPEGYIEPDGNGWQYVYRYTDIWGNTRLTYSDDNNDGNIDAASEIRREQNYYPFGLEHKRYNNVSYGVKNDLKTYQGQEFTEDLGLNTHEWKYRMSDPSLGRFWQIDPLAEDYMYNSTYAFQENKLGIGIELEGAEVLEWVEKKILDLQNSIIGGYNNNIDKAVFEASGKIDMGVQAGAKLKLGGLVDANVSGNLVSVDLVSGKADLTEPANPESYTGDYIGEDGNADFTHGAGLEVGVLGKPLIGGDITVSHTSDNPNADIDGGLYLAVPLTQTKSRANNKSSVSGPVDKSFKAPYGKSKTGVKGEFYGVDLGAGAALGLGIKVNLKIGYNADPEDK